MVSCGNFTRILGDWNESWVGCFTCCIAAQSARGLNGSSARGSGRCRIDRSMIGSPTDFRHTAHIGAGTTSLPGLTELKSHLGSKGGYEYAVHFISSPSSSTSGESASSSESSSVSSSNVPSPTSQLPPMQVIDVRE